MTNIDYECIIQNLEKRLFNKFYNYEFEIEKIKNDKNYDENLRDILLSKIYSLIIMKNGLYEYLNQTKNPTFIGWIAHDYPENLLEIERIKHKKSYWIRLWNLLVIKANNKTKKSKLKIRMRKTYKNYI